MHAQRKDRRGDLIPVIVAAIVAVVGTGAILFNDFGPDNNSLGSGNRLITAAVVSRAGAIEIPSEAARRPAGILGGRVSVSDSLTIVNAASGIAA
jgi:hypothetical protein